MATDAIIEVVAISALKLFDCMFIIKVLIIESGPTKKYNKATTDTRKLLKLVDEEGFQ
ncbi:hypothetical protein P3S68_018886 [Capsicum galapagoense]